MIKKVVSVLGVIALLTVPSNSAFAASGEEIGTEYIYVDSIDEVDINKIGSNEVVAVPDQPGMEEGKNTSGNIGVSMVDDRGRYTYIPTEKWDIASEGKYSFSGSADHSTLYTNYKFVGETHYVVTCHNSGSEDLKIQCKTLFNTIRTETVKPGITLYFSVLTDKAKDAWYIRFTAPSDFYGTVN